MDANTTPLVPPVDTGAGDGAELRKPHEMIVMVPRSKRVTLTGRRIYNALLQVSQARLVAMDSMPAADYMFEAPLPAILRTTGSSGEDRTAAKRYLKEMRGLEVDWESTAPGDGVKWRGFSMLSEVAIEVRNGENWVSWSYPPTIMAALREPKRWARIDLDILACLSSYVAVALYEICARYRDNPSGLTSRKPVEWWTDALSQVPAGTERREWRKFKNERVNPAIEEINAESDLEIELIELKQGRAVVEAQFAVRKKRVERKPKEAPELVDANLALRAESLGIRELKLEGLIKAFGEPSVRDKIAVLERRATNDRLRGVENAYSYLRSLLRNDGAAEPPVESAAHSVGELLGEPQHGSTESRPQVVTGPPLATPNPDAAWVNERITGIKAEIQGLSAEQRQGFVDAAIHELTLKGLMNAVITRRAAQGDVLHGMLGAYVVRQFA
ncbi:MAG: replication initiation protein, partial [Paludibacterium sp.]|uniref:replication initiation protein n=1 Tax=Paludibacterium sp. TaxID=1917523 RepID=UPI0025EBE912